MATGHPDKVCICCIVHFVSFHRYNPLTYQASRVCMASNSYYISNFNFLPPSTYRFHKVYISCVYSGLHRWTGTHNNRAAICCHTMINASILQHSDRQRQTSGCQLLHFLPARDSHHARQESWTAIIDPALAERRNSFMYRLGPISRLKHTVTGRFRAYKIAVLLKIFKQRKENNNYEDRKSVV